MANRQSKEIWEIDYVYRARKILKADGTPFEPAEGRDKADTEDDLKRKFKTPYSGLVAFQMMMARAELAFAKISQMNAIRKDPADEAVFKVLEEIAGKMGK